MSYESYENLQFMRPEDGVLLVTIHRPERHNAADERLHTELSRVWVDIADDSETRVAVVTGSGDFFCPGGDLDMVERMVGNYELAAHMMKEGADVVYNLLGCEKPVVSAINGPAAGAGAVVALLADISIAAEDAKLTDGHLRIGVTAGDHAAIVWPLLCGMAKAKYYLLTSEAFDGREAERIGLVSRAVPRAEVLPTAVDVASRLAAGPQQALRWTKRVLNNWVRGAGPTFDASLALELLGFFSDDVKEGVRAVQEKRSPVFPSAQ